MAHRCASTAAAGIGARTCPLLGPAPSLSQNIFLRLGLVISACQIIILPTRLSPLTKRVPCSNDVDAVVGVSVHGQGVNLGVGLLGVGLVVGSPLLTFLDS